MPYGAGAQTPALVQQLLGQIQQHRFAGREREEFELLKRQRRFEAIQTLLNALASGAPKETVGEELGGVGFNVPRRPVRAGGLEDVPGEFELETPAERSARERQGRIEEAEATNPILGLQREGVKKFRESGMDPGSIRSYGLAIGALTHRVPGAADLLKEDIVEKYRAGGFASLNQAEQRIFEQTTGIAPNSVEERLLQKAVAGEALNDVEQTLFDAVIAKSEAPLLKAIIEGMRHQESMGLRREELGVKKEDLAARRAGREGAAAERGRRDVLARVQRQLNEIKHKHERGRQDVPLGADRQGAMARVDAAEAQEIQAFIEQQKKLYPDYVDDIESFLAPGVGPRRPSLREMFEGALGNEGESEPPAPRRAPAPEMKPAPRPGPAPEAAPPTKPPAPAPPVSKPSELRHEERERLRGKAEAATARQDAERHLSGARIPVTEATVNVFINLRRGGAGIAEALEHVRELEEVRGRVIRRPGATEFE